MSKRTRALRVRSGLAIALPVAAVLALAPAASAASTVYENPPDAATLVTDVNTAATGGTTTVITLNNNQTYNPTTAMVVPSGANVELVTSPQLFASSTNDTVVSGLSVTPTPDNTFTVPSGANLLVKGIILQQGGSPGGGTASILVQSGGGAEIDNSEILQSQAYGVWVDGSAVINNSLLLSNTNYGVNNPDGNVVMNNDDVMSNTGGGVQGNATFKNVLLAKNTGHACSNGTITATNSMDSDGTCKAEATSGVTQSTNTGINAASPSFKGGPTQVEVIPATSAAVTGSDGTGCETVDQRFFTGMTTSKCAIGSYQIGAAQDATSPSCPGPGVVHEATSSTDTSTQTITASDPRSGFGPDSILPGEATTNNGTVAWPMLPTSQFDSTFNTSGSDGFPSTDDLPASTFPVTASKPMGDQSVNDTHWSFTISSWAGISPLMVANAAPTAPATAPTAADYTNCS